jgi:hypothetical protein
VGGGGRLKNDCGVLSVRNSIEFVVYLFIEHFGVVIEVMHKFKSVLMSVAFFQSLPQLFCFGFGETVVDDIATSQHHILCEEELCEESEDDVGRGIASLAFEILHEGAQLSDSFITKQSFCH